MRKLTLLFIVVVLAFSGWFVYSKVTQSRRDARDRVVLVSFQRDLHPGMARAAVREYLVSHNANFHTARYGGSTADTYEIEIGTEPDGPFCEDWTVYVALDFTVTDELHDLHLRKVSTCL
jgi:hypothetical protein